MSKEYQRTVVKDQISQIVNYMIFRKDGKDLDEKAIETCITFNKEYQCWRSGDALFAVECFNAATGSGAIVVTYPGDYFASQAEDFIDEVDDWCKQFEAKFDPEVYDFNCIAGDYDVIAIEASYEAFEDVFEEKTVN